MHTFRSPAVELAAVLRHAAPLDELSVRLAQFINGDLSARSFYARVIPLWRQIDWRSGGRGLAWNGETLARILEDVRTAIAAGEVRRRSPLILDARSRSKAVFSGIGGIRIDYSVWERYSKYARERAAG